MPNRRTCPIIAATLVLVVAPSNAYAGDTAAAEALFNAAKELIAQDKVEEACPKFEASYRLDRTLGTLLNLADCHEKIGKTATAWAEWAEGFDRAAKAGDSRASYAKQRRDALAGNLAKLEIVVTPTRRDLEVFRDETHVEEAMFGVALPVDPGAHSIVVKRGDRVVARRQVEVAAGGTETVQLDLTAIGAATTEAAPMVAPATEARSSPSAQSTVGWIVGGVGLGAVVGAAVLEVLAVSTKPGESDKAKCVDKFCTAAGMDDVSRAETFADVGQWVGIGGLVALAVGGTLILTSPRPEPPAKTGRWIAPWAAPTAAGVAFGGRL